MTTNTHPKALTIAVSDSSGGAGIQADLKTFSALGCYGMSVVVGLTAQNTQGVRDIHTAPPEFTTAQLDAIMEDIGTDAVKTGMLFDTPIIEAVVAGLKKHNPPVIITDPVMVAQSGDKLLLDEAVSTLKNQLFPLTTLITPNIHEAGVLLERDISSSEDPGAICRELAAFGSQAVLLKGGHSSEASAADYLFIKKKNKVYRYDHERIETPNTHGTGCTLASAIASYMALGKPLADAVREAKSYISGAIKAGAYYRIGQGSGPVHHFYRNW